MKNERLAVLFCAVMIFSFVACQKKTPKILSKGVVAVEGTVLRATPALKTKIITTLSWGEAIEFSGKVSEDKKFTQIKVLSDGSEGWVQSVLVKKDVLTGGIVSAVESFQRPDLMSKTLQKLSPPKQILVLESKGGWMKIAGRGIKTGWVKSKAISTESSDVLACKLLDKAAGLAKAKKKDDAVKVLKTILRDYSSSKFAEFAQKELEKLTSPPEDNLEEEKEGKTGQGEES